MVLWAFLGALGRSWRALGSLLGRFWAVLGRSWVVLGGLGSLLGRLWVVLGRLGACFVELVRCSWPWVCFVELIRCSRSWVRFVELIRRFPFSAAQVWGALGGLQWSWGVWDGCGAVSEVLL